MRQEIKNGKQKNEQDIELLRMEREAYDEAVNSLKFECDELKLSLKNEYIAKEQLKNQINALLKKISEQEEEKLNS